MIAAVSRAAAGVPAGAHRVVQRLDAPASPWSRAAATMTRTAAPRVVHQRRGSSSGRSGLLVEHRQAHDVPADVDVADRARPRPSSGTSSTPTGTRGRTRSRRRGGRWACSVTGSSGGSGASRNLRGATRYSRQADAQDRHRGRAARDAADTAAAPGARSGEQHARVGRLDAPRARPRRRAPPRATRGRGGRCGRRAGRRRPRGRPGCAPRGRAARPRRAPGSPRAARPARCPSSASVAASAALAGAVGVRREQPRRHVQAERGERLVAGRAQVGPEDRVVGQRVAVRLDGRHVAGCGRRRPAGTRSPARSRTRARGTCRRTRRAGRSPSAAAAGA